MRIGYFVCVVDFLVKCDEIYGFIFNYFVMVVVVLLMWDCMYGDIKVRNKVGFLIDRIVEC